jgi:hypothetical protein
VLWVTLAILENWKSKFSAGCQGTSGGGTSEVGGEAEVEVLSGLSWHVGRRDELKLAESVAKFSAGCDGKSGGTRVRMAE